MDNFTKIKAADRYYLEASDMHPADTYFHFSFANYYNPANMNFGVLRVINDDNVKPESGFTTHSHQNMEIFSYIVSGKLTHRDSAGNHEILSRGHVQCISAGSGVAHSELNEQTDWCRFLQIWILPEAMGLPVRYELHKYSAGERENKLLQIIAGSNHKDRAPLYVCQDINAYASELTEQDATIPFALEEDRQAYIYCFEGGIDISGLPSLEEGDSLKMYGPADMEFTLASDMAHFILIEMPLEKSGV